MAQAGVMTSRRPPAGITTTAVITAVTAVLSAAAVTPSFAQSPNALRGQRLYENTCIACHGESVHDRKQRAATSFAMVRDYVVRWSRIVSTQWTEEDISDVTIYLNERYYRFVCPTETCRAERAGLPPALAKLTRSQP